MGAVRHALQTKFGVAVVVFVLALVGTPTLFGVARGTANDVHATARGSNPGGQIAAAAPRAHAPVAARVIPFTTVDLFLLGTGGMAVLVCGANIGRRRSAEPVTEPRRARA
jgi:hypothetical protein